MKAFHSITFKNITSITLYLSIIALIIYTAVIGSSNMGYSWQWYRIPDFFYKLSEDGFEWGKIPYGLVGTLWLSIISFALSLLIGALIAFLRLSGQPISGAVANILVELLRNTPLLVLLYLCYYIFGPIFGLDRYQASVICLALFQSAQISEVFRAGINAVPRGQFEAANTIGLSTFESYRFVILPQSIKLMLPPLTGEAIHMIKNSAIVSVIAVVELTTVGRNLISDTYMSFEIWFTIALVYLVVTVLLSALSSYLERRYTIA